MTIPRLPGLFEEIQPGLQGFQSGLQQLFRPDLPAQLALKQQLIQDPSVVAAIQNMNPAERQAYLDSLGLRNQNFRNNLMSMPLGQKAQLEDMKMKALGSLSPDERVSVLTGTDSPLDKAKKQQDLKKGEIDLTQGKQQVDLNQQLLEDRAREAALKARRDEIIKAYKGNTKQLYSDYIGGKFKPDDIAAISSDKGLSSYFETKSREDFQRHQLEFQQSEHALNRDLAREQKQLTIAAAMANAAGQPGSIQEFIAIQDPVNRKKAFDASTLRQTNSNAFSQLAQTDPSIIGLADAADGLKQISAERKNRLIAPIKDRLQRAESVWSNVVKNSKSKPEDKTAASASLEANVQDALQTLATINGQSIQVDVKVQNPERHLLSSNKEAGIQVTLAGPGYTTQPLTLQQAQQVISRGGSSTSKSANSTGFDVDGIVAEIKSGKVKLADIEKSPSVTPELLKQIRSKLGTTR